MNEIVFFISIQVIAFGVGVALRALSTKEEKKNNRFGLRFVYILIPAFFVGYYSSDFLLKDWIKK